MPLIKPIKICNVDRSKNLNGKILEKCLIPMTIQNKKTCDWYYVTALGNLDFIFGMPWLKKYNPEVDWREKTLSF